MNKQKAKEKAKDRDGWECQFCGMDNDTHKDEFDCALHAHHIVKDADGGEDHPRNLITVCRDCHSTLESTQADALSRIKDKQTDEHDITRLENEIEKKEAKIEALENQTTCRADVKDALRQVFLDSSFDVHLVSCKLGTKCELYYDDEKNEALEAYNEWGSAMERKRLHIPDHSEHLIVEEVLNKLEEKNDR